MIAHRGRRRPPRPLGQGRRWLIVALVLFVILDVILVALALAAHRDTVPLQHGPIPTFSSPPHTPAPTPSATSTTPATSAPAAAGQVTPLASARFLTATSGTQAWRASSGSCGAASAVLEHTTDAGATWTRVTAGSPALHQVLALGGTPERTWIAGTGGGACTPHFYASYTQGRFWAEYASELPAVAYLAANGALHLPAGSEKAPCGHPQRVVVKPGTGVLCPSAFFEQGASGSWTRVSVPGAVAMAGSDSGYLLAVTGVKQCDGLAIESLPTSVRHDAKPKQLGCAPGPAAPDGVALASGGGSVWLWNGSTVRVSTDGGVHW